MKWTNDKIEQIRKLVDKKLSIKEIADIMNTTYSSVEKTMGRRGIHSKYRVETISSELKVKLKKAEMGEFIADMGKKLVEEVVKNKIVLPEIPLKNKSKLKREEYSVLDISDIHYGMINEVLDSFISRDRITYNKEIFLKELGSLQNSICQIHGLLSGAYRLRKLYINILGDVITNDRIFQGQEFHIASCYGKQLWEIQVYLINFINNLLKYYEEIEITCVVGNHGRSTDTYKTDEPVENNFEYHIYRIIQIAFEKNNRIKVNVPTSYEHIVTIGGWRHLLLHGDKFRGSSKNYIEKQVKDLILNVGNFDYIDMGHFHFCGKTPVGEHVIVKHNGCWIEKDNYAFRLFKTYSIPEQHFYGCNDKRKKTWSYEIDLRTNYRREK